MTLIHRSHTCDASATVDTIIAHAICSLQLHDVASCAIFENG